MSRRRAFVFTITRAAWSRAVIIAAMCATAAPARCDDEPEPSPPKNATSTKIIPLPVFATLPNEGITFGVMPIFLVVETDTQRTLSIWAPSLTWNTVIGLTGTGRLFHYPSADSVLTARASISQRVNVSGSASWVKRPLDAGRWTDDISLKVERSIFFRFFGLGPDSTAESETSHTRVRGQLDARRGYNLGSTFNLGARLSAWADNTVHRSVPGLAASQDVFPNVPGMDGASVIGGGFDIRYDSRPDYEYSRNGVYSDFSVRWFEGVWNSPSFARFEFETRVLREELEFLQLGARLYTSFVSARDAPFFYQSSLGGSFLMRGFTEDRFIDRGAWTIEMEQRVRLFKLHLFGVISEWRLDPFVAVGQVFGERDQIFSHVRVAEGIGFRAYARPNVLGRIDVAYGGEGPKVYVELGYPF
jgi:hypothetical protein